jgi:hypothetical protein
MSNEKKATSAKSKRIDLMRILDYLPRNLWVEDAESVLRHCLFNLDQSSDEEAGQVAH